MEFKEKMEKCKKNRQKDFTGLIYRLKAGLFLVWLIFIIPMISINLVSGADFDNLLSKSTTAFDGKDYRDIPLLIKYPALKIDNWFGLGGTIEEAYISEHTESCSNDCQSNIKIKLYEDGQLVEDIKFDKPVKNYWMFIKTGEKDIDDYGYVNIGTYPNGSEIIEWGVSGTHKESTWKAYLGEVVSAGEYEIKLVANKSANKIVDWQIKTAGIWTTDWATWGAGVSICYQESANVSTACGGLPTGIYTYSGSFDGGSEANKCFDGDWTTLCASSAGNVASVWVNYTVPTGATNESKIQVKHGVTPQIYANISINSSCWNTAKLQFKLTSKQIATTNTNVSCWSGTNWVVMSDASGANAYQFYEEAMVWNISSSQINLNSPDDNYNATGIVNFNCSAIPVGTTLTNISLWHNASGIWGRNQTNTTINPESNTTIFSVNLPTGSYLWTCEGCDSDGDCGFATTNRTINKVLYKIISESYSSPTTTGAITPFILNIETSGTSVTIVYLNYNGTNYLGSINSSGDNYTLSRSITAPTVSEQTNFSFYWNITFSEGDNINTASKNQTINPIGINSSCANMFVIFNFTIKDEISPSIILNGATNSTSIKLDLNLYNSDRTSLLKQFSNLFNNTNPVAVCINNNLSGGEKYSVDVQVQYGAGNYSSEFYNIERYDLNLSSLNQNISLYDLDNINTQKFKLIAKDSSYLPINNALIQIKRKYIENGTYFISEIPKTNSDGITSASLQLNDVIYDFYIYKNNVLVSSFTNVIAICQNPLISTCEINFNTFQEGIDIPDYELGDDFNFTLNYNKTSKIVSSQFIIPSGNPATIKLEVIKEDALGTAICDDTITSASGTLSCVVPNSFGNSTVRARLYKNNIEQGFGNIKLDETSSGIFGVVLILLSVLVLMTLIGVAVSDNPIVTGVFLFVGVVLIFALNLVNNTGFIGATATILFLAIAIILIIIKASRRS